MSFPIYPNHEYACPNVSHCPHLGGASVIHVGHPGWFRKTPKEYDWSIDVNAPRVCPCCMSRNVTVLDVDPQEHLQEDIIDGQFRVVLYRHETARCCNCDTLVQKAGPGEILASRIGPGLRSKAIYLRNAIGISYRKVPRAIEELYGIKFTAAALIGFEKALAKLAEPVVDDIAKKLASSDGAVHADETYWTLDGQRAYFWVHGDEKFIHFTFETTRAGFVSRDILGPDFCGTLVTDCYSGYNAQIAGAKQKCLAHLARTAREWQKLVAPESVDYQFFEDVKQFVKRGTRLHRRRKAGKLKGAALKAEIAWLRKELERLPLTEVKDEKAIQLQGRILRHLSEWLVFVDDARVSPTNNLAERAIRPLVVLRKISFGSRSREGGERMADLMSVAETARRHGHRASDIYYGLFTRPPDQVLCSLYASAWRLRQCRRSCRVLIAKDKLRTLLSSSDIFFAERLTCSQARGRIPAFATLNAAPMARRLAKPIRDQLKRCKMANASAKSDRDPIATLLHITELN